MERDSDISRQISKSSFSELRLPKFISDGMVLQRESEIKLWGWANPKQKVTVNFIDKAYSAITGDDGKWLIRLDKLKAGGPHNMVIKAEKTIILKDILIGDVWFCSGQSNMTILMSRVSNIYGDEIAKANDSFIRLFTVPLKYSFKAQEEDVESENWIAANRDNILSFTAVGYFFAKALFERYHVPIGLINSSVGGSPVTAWMSEECLKNFPEYLETMDLLKDDEYIDNIKSKDEEINNNWCSYINDTDKGLKNNENKWFDFDFNASDWQTINLPAYFEDRGVPKFNGVIWLRKEVNISKEMTGKPARLLLGRIVDSDLVYVNGVFVGETTYQYPPRRYTIPKDLLREGNNIIVVRVVSKIDKGGFIKDKPYELIIDDNTIDLKGQWKYKIGAIAKEPLPDPTFFQYEPCGLYNGMVAPILNYGIKGVIWYQGESNTSNPAEYHKLFSAMIYDWRNKFDQGEFPFLYVQLPNYMEACEKPTESSWAELREEQFKTLRVPNTGMAVTIDVGEWNDLHPLRKKEVGERLALLAQKLAYGDNSIVCSGPMYEGMKVEGNKIIIKFSNVGEGLIAKGSNELKHFAIAGEDKKYVWGKVKIEKDLIIVWNDNIKNPTSVRYAWADNPELANLYNKNGLPASPFET